MKSLHLALLLVVGLLAITPAASAATGTGTLYVTNASDVQQGSTATVSIYIANDFSPKIGAFNVEMYFDNTVVSVDSIQKYNASNSNTFADHILVNGFNAGGYDNGDLLLATVTLSALKNDGSQSELGMKLNTLSTVVPPGDILTAAIQNGTFTTLDEVDPVVSISTPTSVSSTFNIAGTITDVGGMGTATATLQNTTDTVQYNLPLTQTGASTYTFNTQVTWPIENGVDLIVTATDAAGRQGTDTQVINVVNVGFSDPSPTGYVNATPTQASAFMSQMNKGTVGMQFGTATSAPVPLAVDTSTDYAKGTIVGPLADNTYWVNASGTDNFGDPRSLNWTFTLDTTAPVITAFTISGDDGDGYVEAGETLTLNWNVAADPSFARVVLVDTTTGEELWSSNDISGTATTTITDGNRDLAFRAYDQALNSDSRTFHLYYNYMIWINSTKMGTISGIDTTYTAEMDISRTAISSVTLYNGRTVAVPSIGTLQRSVINVGQVTADTFVAVDNTANRTMQGTETYQNLWVYEPGATLDFLVQVPNAPKAAVLLFEANESYIEQMIDSGSRSVNYTELMKKTAYFFIDGGWTKITVRDDGTFIMDDYNGTAITNAGNISQTLRHPDNQVDLNAGYRLSAQGLKAIQLPAGDYALAAIAMDGDRLGALGAMPISVMESGDQGGISATSVQKGDSFTAQFTAPCERLGVMLIRDVTYDGTALIDAATIGTSTLQLNLTYNGIPATQKLIGNVYISPDAGAYVVANTNQATVNTSGLAAGTYDVYLIGQSSNGTVEAYGQYTVQITPPVTPTPTPTPYTPSGGGGGGGSSRSVTTYEGSATVSTSSSGIVTRSIAVVASDDSGKLTLNAGVRALDADGNPISTISIERTGDVPAAPAGALFSISGYVYECSPAGATFNPGLTLSATLSEEDWNRMIASGQVPTIKWFNAETNAWEDVPTTVNPTTRTVSATVTHFSTFAVVYTTGVLPTPTPTEVVTTSPTQVAPTTPAQPTEELPFMYIIIAIVAILIVAGAAFFYMEKKNQ
ncbi:hypothetical protein FGU65_05245 [Methanoculleus sp. FWC-SCC1]|uniref:Cohesin domain-containing protein n=1 Tax=Methanoculleus frigidifontis TaxID=2584085 RepID=A0ABT8M8P6_9EURY|nr:hypothetical protein [Methanoculleus sp. FWC-SCC1]MDN7024302.1 hypothetical protein [Methanoculleus sp. FWC-SCC1]